MRVDFFNANRFSVHFKDGSHIEIFEPENDAPWIEIVQFGIMTTITLDDGERITPKAETVSSLPH